MSGLPKTFASSPGGGTTILSGTLAARPAFGIADRYYWATDVEELYRDTGTAWQLIATTPTPIRPYIVGNYYRAIHIGSALAASDALAANTLYAMAYPVVRTQTFDRLHITLAVTAAINARVGIYNDGGAGYPGTLLLDAGAISMNAAEGEATINQQLIGGLYWLAVLPAAGGTSIYREYNTSLSILGNVSDARTSNFNISVAQAYGVLPTPFTAGGAYSPGSYSIALRLLSTP